MSTPAPQLKDEKGSMLMELVIAMLFLSLAVGALISVYSSSILSLRHAGIEGTATTLVDRQLELYNTLPYASIALDASTIPSGSDKYVTAHGSDATIPSSTGQITGGTAVSGSCTSPTTPQPACATQTLVGADRLSYRVDTYIVSVTPPKAGSRAVKQVTVVVRDVAGGTVGSIRARAQSAYDACNPPPTTAGATC
jgi:hypothetical protein